MRKQKLKPTDIIGKDMIQSWDRVNQVFGVLMKNGDILLEETLTNKVFATIPAQHVRDALAVLTSLTTDETF